MEWVISDDGSMSGDELLVLFGAGALALQFWPRFYRTLARASPLYRNARELRLLGGTPALLSLLLVLILSKWADPVVRGSVGYLLLFVLVGALFMRLALQALPYLGMSVRDDVIEAKNPAAALAVCGALTGTMLSFAGSNVGTGPTIWTTMGPAVLSFGVFLFAWWLLEMNAHCSEAVTLDRDVAAGARLAGFLVASGAVLGRAAAGDWVSTEATVAELARGSVVVLALVVVAVVAHKKMRPSPKRPAPALLPNGVLVAGAYLAASGTWIWSSLPVK